MHAKRTPLGSSRLAMRRQARRLMFNPLDVSAHWERLQAALELPGNEPVQGALADIFVALGSADVAFKRKALHKVKTRLAAHVVRWFDAQTDQGSLPRITPLATRWSVLARPSADISTRARRCGPDDSRALAEQVVRAVQGVDAQAQLEFLHHCVTCHDNLAFMLARRVLLRGGAVLPSDWEAVSLQLEQPRALA